MVVIKDYDHMTTMDENVNWMLLSITFDDHFLRSELGILNLSTYHNNRGHGERYSI